MKFTKLRSGFAILLAYLMGMPMAETAQANGVGGIIQSSVSLAAAIVDIAGDS